MTIRFNAFGIPLVCLMMGAALLLGASAGYDNRSDALIKLHTWATSRATVIQMEDLGTQDHVTKRATVSFNSPDGKRCEGYLFDGIEHAWLQVLSIRYDPQGHYVIGEPGNAKQVFTDAELSDEAGPQTLWSAIGCLAGGIILITFGGYRMYRQRKLIFVPAPGGRLTRPEQLLSPSAKQREALQQIPGYDGRPRQTPVDFVVAPPPEIGAVLSAESSIPAGGANPILKRLAVGGLAALLIIVGFFCITQFGDDHANDRGIMITGGILAACVLAAHAMTVRYKADCTYIGKQGLARCKIKGSFNTQVTNEVVLFDQAAELHAEQTDILQYSFYRITNYDFFWTDSSGRIIWQIKGSYDRRKQTKEGSAWRFAQAAETAWSTYYSQVARTQLSTQGSILFRIDDRRSLRIGSGFIEFNFNGDPVRLKREDIASFTLNAGTFAFKSTDARWYSLMGKYSFSHGQMANAKVFLHVLNKLMGLQIDKAGQRQAWPSDING